MKRLSAYPIRLQNNKISKPSRYRSLRWAVIEGDGDGDVNGHTICLKDADTSDSICQRTYIGRTTLKESANHPLTVS